MLSVEDEDEKQFQHFPAAAEQQQQEMKTTASPKQTTKHAHTPQDANPAHTGPGSTPPGAALHKHAYPVTHAHPVQRLDSRHFTSTTPRNT